MGRLIVSGAARGIGRYLCEQLGGLGLTRESAPAYLASARGAAGADIIVHCAYDSSKSVPEPRVHAHFADTIGLTGQLLAAPHRAFVFFSSVDVYARDGALKTEEDTIVAGDALTPYSYSKLVCEALVRQRARRWLIVRPVQMLGDGRRNIVARIMAGDPDRLPLTAASVLNCVLYEDVAAFVKRALERELTGTFNLAASRNATLAEIASAFGRAPAFGDAFYDIGLVSNGKAAAIVPAFARTTVENLSRQFGMPVR
jgi:nucleoside-diphosphate-sugar epimerase